MVQISLSTSTTFDGEANALIEDQNTALTINLELDEPSPNGGLKVFVDSDVEQIVNRLNLPGFSFNPVFENINPNLVGTSFDNSGFFLTIDEGATTASFTINVFDNVEPDTFLPETFDGLVEANFALVPPGEVEAEDLGDVGTLGDYTIDSNAASSTVLFADTESQLSDISEPPEPPTPGELPLVSLNTGPDFLVEEEGTVSAHVFNITNGTIPEEGLVVSVSAPNLSEFDLDGINISEGGEIVAVREDGFDIRLSDFTVLVDLPVAADGETEGLETASFSLEAGNGYEVNEDFSSGEFTLVDTADELPVNTSDRNDTIPLARDISLSAENSEVTLEGSIDFDIGNRYQNEDGNFTYVDAAEDVDFYKFELEAGDLISIDTDAVVEDNPPIAEAVFDFDNNPISVSRLFDADGNELAVNVTGQGPGELFIGGADDYIEFVTPEDGTYYLGISTFPTATTQRLSAPELYRDFPYDPFTPASGNGESYVDFVNLGDYQVKIALNPENPVLLVDQSNRSNNTPPEAIDLSTSGEPTVSLNFTAATYASDEDPRVVAGELNTDDVLNGSLVEGSPFTGSVLTMVLTTDGEIPTEGIFVTVNSTGYLRDYFSNRSFETPPFSPGAELVDVVTDDTGRETGFQLRIFEPVTFFPLNARTPYWGEMVEPGPNGLQLQPETDGPEEVTFFLEGGEGYGVSETANQITPTFYDSAEQAGTPSVIPEVSLTISEDELIESEGTQTTLNFSLSEAPPEEGVLVYVKGSSGVLPQFDVLNAEVSGGVYPTGNFDFSGFYFKVTEPVASVTLTAFEDPFTEGLQSFSLALQETPLYTINAGAQEVDFTIADNPDSVVEVSLISESVAVESNGAAGLLTLNLTASPPTDGLEVTVNTDNLSEFDISDLIVTGGEIIDVTDTGFSLNITDVTATVELSPLSDGEAEGVETAVFSLSESSNYLIDSDASEATITLVDVSEQVPVTSELDPNDSIAAALDINLNSLNPDVTITGSLASQEPNEDYSGTSEPTEDIDFYSFTLEARDTVKLDIDTVPFETTRYPGVEQILDSELRLFDADGNELASVNNAAAPDEEFSRDPYLEFTAESAGTYYVGVSQLGNNSYNPLVDDNVSNGSGWFFPEIGVFFGEYDLNVELEPATTEPTDDVLVSLNTGPDFLVEEDGTVSAHVFNVTGGTIPEDGLVVSVSAPNLSEFDLDGINVSEGGEIVAVREDGFDIRLTDFTALVDLPIANDGETEGVETASFTLEAGAGYEVNSDFSSGEFTLVETADEIPADALNKRNDILPLATSVELNEDEPTFLTTTIDFEIGNRYQNDDGSFTYVDATEDVDLYSFELSEGDTIAVDIDSIVKGNPSIQEFERDLANGAFTTQRIFDSEGNELSVTVLGQGPGELFATQDSYTEFMAPSDGTYYLGISVYPNGNTFTRVPEAFGFPVERWQASTYNPFVPGSGNGAGFPEDDVPLYGEYDLTVVLNPDTLIELPDSEPQSITNTDQSNNQNDQTQSNQPTVSLDFLTGTVASEIDDTLVSGSLIEGLPTQSSFIALTFETEGEIPEEGIVVNVNSDAYLRDYITNRFTNAPPFTPGAELIDVISDETGQETGFQLRIFEANTFVVFTAPNLLRQDIQEPETDGPEEVTFFLELGEGYAVESSASEITATYYDSFEQAGEPSVIPEVSLSISETELVESEGTEIALSFSLSEPPPSGGVLVYVASPQAGALPQFNVLEAEVSGGIYPIPDGGLTGFYFKITEQEASITLPVFEDPFDEGLQGYSLTLQEAPLYTIDPNAGEVSYTISDTPDSVVEVSLITESEILVESEDATATLSFNLTAAPPAEGITVSVDAPNLSEFDVDAFTVTGGEITEITDNGFSLNITDVTATVELPVLSDGDSEGQATATFSLVETANSTINPEANEVAFTLYDTPEQVAPPTSEDGDNDTISEAVDTRLSSVHPAVTINGSILGLEPNEYEEDFSSVDFTEDVDLYSFELDAGDTVTIDVDAINELVLTRYELPQSLDSELRLFDADGNELANVNNAAAPDEDFSRDPYLEFTASEAGTYYVGVSQLGNNNYDPNVEGSGSGWIFPEIGVYAGEYDLNVSLTDGDRNLEFIGTDDNDTLEGNNGDDLVAGLLGDDTILGNDGDDVLRGDANSRDPGGSVGGDDVISGGDGNDQIGGKAGNDLLSGDAGDDEIFGDDGDDTIMGGTGDDTLTGDDFSGGSGSDLFVFANGDGTDIITDFDVSEDLIGLVSGELTFEDIDGSASLTVNPERSRRVKIIDLDGNAAINVLETGETLAVLNGVGSDELTPEMFVITPDVSSLEDLV